MEREEFIEMLQQKGFAETVQVERAANDEMDWHAHPFEALALVLDGDLWIETGEARMHYAKGERFHLVKDERHREGYGDRGVRYLVGRKS